MQNRDITDNDLNSIFYNFKLRSSDFDELYAISNNNPYEQVIASIKQSESAKCLTDNNGEIYCIFGVRRVNEVVGVIWMVASDAFEVNKLYSLRQSKKQIKEYLDSYEILYNTCSLYNKASVKYLDWLGFLFDIHSVRPAQDGITPVINFSLSKRWYEYNNK